MKTYRLFAAMSLFAFSHFAYAEDLTVSNKVYKDYQVIRTQPDAIVIKYSAGIATLYFWELPADLQKKYNYDPAKAQEYEQKVKEQQAERQAKELEQKAQAEIASQLAETTLMLNTHIVQALPNGALAEASTSLEQTDTVDTAHFEPGSGIIHSQQQRIRTTWESFGLVFIQGINVHDDENHTFRVVPSGDYEYTTLEGAYKKVRKFVVVSEVFTVPQGN